MFIKKLKIFLSISLFISLISCAGFKPLYKYNLNEVYKLQYFSIVTDKKKISNKIKKDLVKQLPANKKTKYIVKIATNTETSASVSDASRKISRYKTNITANVELYQRYRNYDKLIYSFSEQRNTSYNLILNNIRSTLASKNKAEATTIKLLAEEIYRGLLIFLSNS